MYHCSFVLRNITAQMENPYSLGKVVNFVISRINITEQIECLRIKESKYSYFSAYNLVIALSLILWHVYHIFPTTY
jgi:hypothetical protein